MAPPWLEPKAANVNPRSWGSALIWDEKRRKGNVQPTSKGNVIFPSLLPRSGEDEQHWAARAVIKMLLIPKQRK